MSKEEGRKRKSCLIGGRNESNEGSGSSEHEESGTQRDNLERKFIKASRKLKKASEKLEKASEVAEALRSSAEAKDEVVKALRSSAEAKDEVAKALRKITVLSVEKEKLSNQLSNANLELLDLKNALTSRGAIELFEDRHGFPDNQKTRRQKYVDLFNSDADFRQNVYNAFHPQFVRATDVGKFAVKLYKSASDHVHKFLRHGSKAVVNKDNKFHPKDLKLLKAICENLNMNVEFK